MDDSVPEATRAAMKEQAVPETTAAATTDPTEHGVRRRGYLAEAIANLKQFLKACASRVTAPATGTTTAAAGAKGPVGAVAPPPSGPEGPGIGAPAIIHSGGDTAPAVGAETRPLTDSATEGHHPGLMTQIANAAHSTLEHLAQETEAVSQTVKEQLHGFQGSLTPGIGGPPGTTLASATGAHAAPHAGSPAALPPATTAQGP